jgi:hypothetical protein
MAQKSIGNARGNGYLHKEFGRVQLTGSGLLPYHKRTDHPSESSL